MLKERISKHFCISFTQEDAQVAIPMMIASIMALVILL